MKYIMDQIEGGKRVGKKWHVHIKMEQNKY